MTHTPTPTPTNRPGISAHGGYGIHGEKGGGLGIPRLDGKTLRLLALMVILGALGLAAAVCAVCADETWRVYMERVV